MKKLKFLILLTAATAFAVGPKVPCILSWSPVVGADGYYFYWWATNGAANDQQKLALSTNSFTSFDLRVLGLAQNDYNTGMTTTNISGAESVLSDLQVWHFHNPNKPGLVTIKLP
jgi:hypothetical protein